MSRRNRLALGLFAILALAAGPASAAIEYVIVISVDGLGGTYLNKMFNGTAPGGPYSIPNFTRLKNEGASTLAAHIDNNNWETLPNHVSILTARPRDNSPGFDGHNWTSNGDPAVGQTIHSNKGSYVASVFDVVHDTGLRTGMYANKSKFSLFDTYGSYLGGGSYNATYGAPDTNPVGGDNGRDKVDSTYINTALGGIIVNTFIAHQIANPMRFAFVHINEPDSYGHSTGWGSITWYNQVVNVDTMLGNVFKLVEQDVPAMIGKTALIVTADHGNQDNPPTPADRYAVPFFVWGPGVAAGADLYALNVGLRQPAASYPMTTYAGMQPIRNAEAPNLALDLLGLDPIPGSSFNYAQDLKVAPPGPVLARSPAGFSHTIPFEGSPAADSFTVWNAGEGTLEYTITDNGCYWLDVNPLSGTSTGEADTMTIAYATAGLGPGGYDCTITISAPGADPPEATIALHVTVEPPSYRGDFDLDQDVDLGDFAYFQACFNGPNRSYALPGSCDRPDLDSDNDVDLSDFGAFQACFNGPNRPPPPGCRQA